MDRCGEKGRLDIRQEGKGQGNGNNVMDMSWTVYTIDWEAPWGNRTMVGERMAFNDIDFSI